MKVYIACPYTIGDVTMNVRSSILAQDYLESNGFMVYNPLLSHFQHLVLPHRDVNHWYEKDLKWLLECDCVLRLEGESVGADREVKIARERGMPIFYSVFDIPEERG